MLDLTMLAFDLSFKYRQPIVILGDGYLGQMTGKVTLPRKLVKPGIPEWAVFGDRPHRGNLICSIYLAEADLEAHNLMLFEKYERMIADEQRADLFRCEDADTLLVACNTPSQMAKGAVQELRDQGVRAGLFRPITLWPFPIRDLLGVLAHVKRVIVVEASNGQLEDELRLALSQAGVHQPPTIEHVQRYGGVLPQQRAIVDRVLAREEVLS
jgi:pyruvate/2-oxoacid:ferredoxin oxidoreductase alpha subunit